MVACIDGGFSCRLQFQYHSVRNIVFDRTIREVAFPRCRLSFGDLRPTACNPSKADWVVDMSFKILIVDDSPMMRRLVRLSIEENLGWRQCVEAESGRDAIARARETNPDVVILDWQMPGMNGIEAARELSRISPNAAIALFTVHDQDLVHKEAQAAGVDRIFSKTKSLTHLLEWLRTIGGQQHRVVGL